MIENLSTGMKLKMDHTTYTWFNARCINIKIKHGENEKGRFLQYLYIVATMFNQWQRWFKNKISEDCFVCTLQLWKEAVFSLNIVLGDTYFVSLSLTKNLQLSRCCYFW